MKHTPTFQEKMTLLNSIFPTLNLMYFGYSERLDTWYIHETYKVLTALGNGGEATIYSHAKTPEESVDIYIETLKQAKYFYAGDNGNHNDKLYPLYFMKWDETEQKFKMIDMPGRIKKSDVRISEFTPFQEIIAYIESKSIPAGRIAGTSITRVCLDKSLWEEYNVKMPENSKSDSSLVWALSVGLLHEPKLFFYGYTIMEAVQNAVKHIEQ